MDKMKTPTTDKTLLIVEDDILPAIALKQELEDAGFRVLDLTSHPDHALVAAREIKPDLALVNVELHGRDDGIELASDLKSMGIPVLFISGQISRAKTAQTVAIGSLPKPYHPADIVQAVHYLLAHLQGDDTLRKPYALEVFDGVPNLPDPGPVETGLAG